MEESLKMILNRLDTLQTDINGLKAEMSGVKTELAEFKEETRQNFAHLTKQVDLTATHVFKHTEKLEKISADIEYLGHRDLETQKELYYLKQEIRLAHR